MRYLFFVITVSVLFLQCTKDKMEVSHECIPHERLSDMQGQPIFSGVYPVNEMAYFNPNNSNEIIYRYADGVSPEFDLIKYNLVTKQKEVIYQGFFSNRPRWGKNGWILLNINDSLGYNIYKIKEDGNDLTPLTTSGNCFYPIWDLESERFSYQYAFTTPTKYILANSGGSFLDTIPCGVGGSWQHPEFIATGGIAGLVVFNPFNCEQSYRYEVESIAQSLNGAEWLDEENVFWCHTTGIYRTNIVTNETEIIRETCNAHCYQRPTYAPDINKIIVEKVERIKDTETSGRIILSLVMMDPDGTEEETIEIE